MNDKPKFTYSLDNPVAVVHTSTLITARAYQKDGKPKGEPKFGATFLFRADHPDMSPMKQMALAAARAKWPGIDVKLVKWPWETGAVTADRGKLQKKDREGFRPFACVLKARSIFEVALSILDGGQIVDLENVTAKNNARDKYFYDGVLCGAVLNFVPYEQDGAFGVTCYLNRVLSTGTGDRIKVGGGPSGAEVFSRYAGRQSSIDPGSNLDADI